MSIKTKWIISVMVALVSLVWFLSARYYILSIPSHPSFYISVIIFCISAIYARYYWSVMKSDKNGSSIYSKTKIIFSDGPKKSQDDIALETLSKIAKTKYKK